MVGQRCCGQRLLRRPLRWLFTDADPDPGTPSDANPLVFNLTPLSPRSLAARPGAGDAQRGEDRARRRGAVGA